MSMSSIFSGHVGEASRIKSQESLPAPGRVLFMIDPQHFDVLAAINPHMLQADGSLQAIDRVKARAQWDDLKAAYRSLGLHVSVLPAESSCPDMVFCANQTFPFLNRDGAPAVILSNMADSTRHLEVASLRVQLEARGVRCYELSPRSEQTLFEGMGDALWVPGRGLICGGYGFRTHASIYAEVQNLTGADLALFELRNPKFYHLDTCLSVLDRDTALACREGFTEEGWQQLHQIFARVLEVPLEEADAPGFACNAHCPDQKHVLLQKGSTRTLTLLSEAGFTPIEVDTTEFIKSGGSVFCMKLQCVWDHWPLEH